MGVSIIMPFRNSERWIEEAISSIQNQSFIHWELIAVNDHSEDHGAEAVHNLMLSDPRIRMVTNEGHGIIAALQTALKHSQNDMITRLDSDDKMPSNRLQWMTDALSKLGRGNLITGKVSYFSDRNLSPGYSEYEHWLNERVDLQDFFNWRFRECVIASPAWLMYKEDLTAIGGFSRLTYPEDYHLVLRWLYEGIRFHGIPETVLHWREHPDRTSRNHEGFAQKAFFDLKLRFLLEKEYRENMDVLVLTSSSPKTKLILDFFESNHIPTQKFSIDTITELPHNDENLLLSAVFPKKQNRKELEQYVESLGYRHGIDFFYL